MKKNKILFFKTVFVILILVLGLYFYSKESNVNQKAVLDATDNQIEENTDVFGEYYTQAKEKLKSLTLDQKIGQLFLVSFSYEDAEDAIEALKQYEFGGYLFFEKDFKGKTEIQVKGMMEKLQNASNIPLLTAVDEEGGMVVRVSSNSNLAESKFKSSMELYNLGGFELITKDTIEKSNLLKNLGINLNLAPVVDISTNSSDYMYKRTLGQDTILTMTYAQTVIDASKGLGVSYTLKHFPGYGSNLDTHKETSVDARSYEDILNNDVLPFKAGIEAGAEAVLVSHNIVTSIDAENPASLSPKIHELLRNELDFTGVIITDDLKMGAVLDDGEAVVKAIVAGNDLIITPYYETAIDSVKSAIQNEEITEKMIDEKVCRILAWKYYKGLM